MRRGKKGRKVREVTGLSGFDTQAGGILANDTYHADATRPAASGGGKRDTRGD